MLKRSLSLALAGLLIHMAFGVPAIAANREAEKEARLIKKVKEGVMKIGVGEKARVAIKLKDKTLTTGYISEIREDAFVVSNKAGDTTTISFANVAQVKGQNLSTGAKIAIGAGIIAAIILIIFIKKYCDNEGGC